MNRGERRAAEARARAKANEAISRLVRAHQTYERERGLELVHSGEGARISCRGKGCASCCEQSLVISYAEAVLIVERFPGVVHEVKPELERQEMLAARLGAHDLPTALSEDYAFAWWKSRTPCAFLDPETRACRVYEARPLVCRNHAVMDQDPALCGLRADSIAQAVETLPEVLRPTDGAAYDRVFATARTITRDLLGGVVLGVLPTLVNHAAERR